MPSLLSDVLRGIATGFLVSIPIGPVALVTIQRSGEYGWRAGAISILPVVALDSAAVMLVLLGMPLSFFRILSLPHIIGIGAAIFLFIFGLRMFRTATKPTIMAQLPWQRNFFTSLALSLANPSTYIGFAGLALLFTRYLNRSTGIRVSIGIGFCIGALLWWGALIAISSLQANHTRSKKVAQRIAGAFLMATAIVMLLPPHYLAHYIHIVSKQV